MGIISKGRATALILTSILLITAILVMGSSGEPTRAPPSGPTNFQLASGDGEIHMTWGDPLDDGGSERVGYNIHRGPAADDLSQHANLGPFEYSYTDTNLLNGKTYFYSVRAINLDDGEGGDSDILSTKPVGPASAPKNVNTSYQSEKITFTWTEPDIDGGNPIQGYFLKKGRSISFIDERINISLVNTYTDTDVENGVPYYYRLFAWNGFVDGGPTNVLQVTPMGKPAIPHNLTIEPQDKQVLLNWSYPLDDGGGSLTGYKVYRGESELEMEEIVELPVRTGYLDNNNVTNGITYFYSVSSINLEGEGVMTTPISVTPLGIPGSPLNLTVDPGDTQARLAWKPPVDDGGKPIMGYKVFRTTLGSQMELIATVDEGFEYTDTDLTNGEIYYYQVKAYNEIGDGYPSESVDIKPDVAPAPPKSFRIKEFDGYVQLLWSLPSFGGDYPVMEFHIYKGTMEDDLELLIKLSRNESMYVDEDVEIGTQYFYGIMSFSRIGEGPMSDLVSGIPFSAPGLCTEIGIEVGNGFVDITWTTPLFTGGRDLTNFKIFRGDSPDDLAVIDTINGDLDSYKDTRVKNGKTYYYAIMAINPEMDGNITGPHDAFPIGPPGKPKNLMTSVVDGGINLQWDPPIDNGGRNVTGYVILRGIHQLNMTNYEDLGLIYNWTDENAEDGVGYFYAISALNSEGTSSPTQASFMEITRGPDDKNEATDLTMIIVMVVVILLIIIAVVIGMIFTQRKKKETEEAEEEILEETDREKERRLLLERRQQMGEFLDVALTTADAHAIDHEEHDLSYEDLYGSKDDEETAETAPTAETPTPEQPAPDYQPPVSEDPPVPQEQVEYQPPPAPVEETQEPSTETTEYIPPSE